LSYTGSSCFDNDLRHREEPRAGAAGEDDSLARHARRFVIGGARAFHAGACA
jgi:hypothetical protein